MKQFTVTLAGVLLLLSCNKENPEDLFFDETFPAGFTYLSEEIYEIVGVANTLSNGIAIYGYGNTTRSRLLEYDTMLTEISDFAVTSNLEGSGMKGTLDGGLLIYGRDDTWSEDKDEGLLIRLDAAHQEVWEREYGTADYDAVSSCLHLSTGGYVLLLETKVGVEPLAPTTLQVLQIDESGFVENQISVDFGNNTGGGDLLEAADGGFVALFNSKAVNALSASLHVVKFKPDLTEEWTLSLDQNSAGGSGSRLIAGSDGGYLILCSSTDPMLSLPNAQDLQLTKLSASGQLEWQESYGIMDNYDYGKAVVATSDGGYLVQGFITNGSPNADNGGLLVLKVDVTGNVLWKKRYGDQNNYSHLPRGIIAIDNDQFILAGNSIDLNTDLEDRYKPWILKIDADGIPIN
ncbi:MAG: hypothetical protein KDC44_07315 [Phaeodactylibacter sp.]|nr:hypothetical protein [Phaeodactylibacter sp.]